MSAEAILVIDAGTSSLRAVSVDANGGVEQVASIPWRMFTPDDAAPFGRELDAEEIQEAVGRLFEITAHGSRRIIGIAFTGQREGVAFVDQAGGALLVAPNVDARASGQGIAIDAAHQAGVYRTTGHLPSLMQVPAKFAWLVANRPELAERVRCALPLSDWLASTLTGTIAASRSLSAENGMLDITTDAAPRELWSLLGAPAGLIPPVVADGGVVGECRVGPLSGALVAMCGGDTQCALVGMGATAAGSAGVSAGWTAPLQLVTATPTFDREMRTWTGVHAVPARYVVESNAGETGRVWEWLLSLLHLRPSEADELAATSPRGARDVMVVHGPARMNAAGMTAGVGAITLPLPVVMSSPEREDVLRAMLEAVAFAIRANLEQAEEVAGVRAPVLRLGGGMARSRLFASILADVVDRPVIVASTPDTTALGAAVLAAPPLGVHDAFDDALAAMVRSAVTMEPDARGVTEYEDVYERWLAMSAQFGSMA